MAESLFTSAAASPSYFFMLVRLELHSHSFFSRDAVCPPEDMIATCRALGLNALAITDHDSCEAYAYLVEKGLANPDGSPVDDFLVIPAVEVSTAQGHLLCYGVRLPTMLLPQAREVCEMVHAQGGLAIPAHPFDKWRAGFGRKNLDATPIDGVEVFNAAVTSRSMNDHARAYAEQRGLPMIAGSDAHYLTAIGTAITSVEVENFTVAGVLDAIRRGPSLETRYLSFWEGFKKHTVNLFSRKPRGLKNKRNNS